MNILHTWKDFFSFLLAPAIDHKERSLLEKSLSACYIFILKVILVIITGLLLHLLFGNPDPKILNSTLINTSIFIALFAGVFEEIVYRLSLTKFNPWYLSISLAGFLFIIIKKLYFRNMLLENEGLLVSSLIGVASFPIFYLITKKFTAQLERFWQKHFGIVFYISAFLFAISHFFNAKELELVNLKSNISHLFSALILGYVRIRSGIVAAIILHIVWDLML